MNETNNALDRPASGGGEARNFSSQLHNSRYRAESNQIADIRTTILIQSPKGGRTIVWLTVVLTLLMLYWMYVSEIEEVTRGTGKVIPSSQLQVVQNLEGGILAETLVKEGDVVEKGQLLMKLDATRFSAPYQESRVKYLSLLAKVARLRAETEGSTMSMPEEVSKEHPELAVHEQQLYGARKNKLTSSLAILEEQALQRKQELTEMEDKLRELEQRFKLLKKELDLTRPLVGQGAASEIEILRLERDASAMQGDMSSLRLSIPRAKSKIAEAHKVIEDEKQNFLNTAKKELTDAQAELEGLSASATALADRLDRTAVRSPVRGTVKQILVNTIGGVVQPGMNLIAIVPLEDSLLVETQIKTSDIAFLRPKQRAMVKFTAYDFTIYGGLEAELELIGADSMTDEKGNSYYLVRVRTRKNYLESRNGQLPIIPGMVATVDIVTGKKTILTYLLKPVLKAREMALRER